MRGAELEALLFKWVGLGGGRGEGGGCGETRTWSQSGVLSWRHSCSSGLGWVEVGSAGERGCRDWGELTIIMKEDQRSVCNGVHED